MEIIISADIVAWYGAIIATSMLILRIVQYFNERIKIIIRIKFNMLVNGKAPGYKENTPYVVITVINRGKRPVTITHVGVEAKEKNGKSGLFSDSFMKGEREITDGKAEKYLVQQKQVNWNKMKYIVVYDAAGRIFKKKIKAKHLKKIKRVDVQK